MPISTMPGATRKNNRPPPWEQGAEAEPVSFGTWLRRQRELRQISLREIADVTKISTRYLEALEQDQFDVLPAPVFARGFLREYARYVGLDPDEVVNSYITAQQSLEPGEETEEVEQPKESFEWTSSLFLALAVVGLLAVVAVLGFYFERARDGAEPELPAIAAPVVEPAPPEPVEEPQAPNAPLLVTMDFTEDCWVEAQVDGRRRLTELHVQGESLRIEAESRVVLTLGNAGGVRLEVNGRPFSLRSAPGRILRDVVIDLETARELERTEEGKAEAPGSASDPG